MSRTLFLYLLCVIAVARFSHAYKDCGDASSLGKIISVDITNCNNVVTCKLKQLTNVSIEINFQAVRDIPTVKTVVHGKLGPLPPIPFPLPNNDACKDKSTGLTCPLAAGKNYSYKKDLYVKKVYPKAYVDVIWQLETEDNQVIVCLNVPSKIVR